MRPGFEHSSSGGLPGRHPSVPKTNTTKGTENGKDLEEREEKSGDAKHDDRCSDHLKRARRKDRSFVRAAAHCSKSDDKKMPSPAVGHLADARPARRPIAPRHGVCDGPSRDTP